MGRFNEENSYSTILKRISAFGGVQVFNIFVNLVRGKFVALFLGPEGMGISSLFQSSAATVQQLGSLGLNLAVVKEIAASNHDETLRSKVIGVTLKLIVLTAVIGGLLCVALSTLLSYWSFGNYDYTGSFITLGIYVAFSIGGAGFLAILQGMSEVKRLTKASLVGGLSGLFLGVPLYYIWGNNGIVPAMILMSAVIFLFYYVSFRQSVRYDKADVRLRACMPLVKKLVSLGLVLMVGSLVGSVVSFVINAFVRAYGDVENVGLFQAANSLTNQYIGVVFSALAMDYFPRLAAVAYHRHKMRVVINRQAEIIILVVTPLVLLLIMTAPWVIRLLLSKEFLVITPLMKWFGFGVMLQAVSFPLSYMYVARDNKKLYVWIEVVATNVMWLLCSIGFYFCFSLIGLGISLVVRALAGIVIDYCVVKKYYGFEYTKACLSTTAVCLAFGVAGFLISLLSDDTFNWYVCFVLLFSMAYSATRLIRKCHS